MKLSLLTGFLLALSVQPVKAVDEQGTIVYDKKRAPKIFSVPQRAAGDYVETMKMITDSHMSFGGKSMDATVTIVTETDVSVKNDVKTGDSHITAKTTRMEIMSETAGFKIECDTNEDKEVAPPSCESLYDAVENSIQFDLGKDGNIIDASGPGSDILMKAYAKKTSSHADTLLPVKTDSSSGSDYMKTWTKSSRMLQLVPTDQEVKAGYQWVSSSDLGDMGHFEGTGTMLGYRSVDDRDCAVFSIVGTLTLDMDKMADVFGSNALMASVVRDMDMGDTTMDTLIYFDYELGIMRWSKTHQTATVTMPDPTGKEGKISIPMDSTAISSCRVKQ
jgi:hypothetical protein